MKKIVSIVVSAFLLFSQIAFAKENDKMAEILELVKNRLSVSDSFDEFSSSSYEDEFSKMYSFSWTNSETNENLDISCTEDGIITSFYNYIPEFNDSNKPAFSDDLYQKSEKSAKEFVKKINPQLADRVVFNEREQIADTYSRNFSFEFYVLENGYKVSTNNGYISINAKSNRVTSFNLNYVSKVDIKKHDTILTKDEAVLKYIEKLGLKLVYKMYRNEKETKIYPAFIEKESSDKVILADSGEIYEPPVNSSMPLYKTMNTASGGAMAEEAAMDRASFTEVELKELDNISGLISKEKAEQIIRSNNIINLSDDLKLGSINLSADYYDKENYNYSLVFRNPDEISDKHPRTLVNLRAVVDAKTGEIKSFNKYYINSEKNNNEKDKFSEDKAKEKANNTLSLLGGKNKADFKLSSDENAPYYYTYTREVNGIPFISNTANITIDQYSGEVLGWSITDTEAVFPDLQNVLSASDAAKKLFEQVTYEPIYLVSYDGKNYVSALVYAITDNHSITLNAETGALINYKGEDIKKESSPVKYTDIDNHYAKEHIEKLASYGIARSDKQEFSPDSAITQKELLAYMLMAFEGEKNISLETEEDVNYIYRRAIRLGLISNENKAPEEEVTRGDTAKMIIHALGFSEIAEIENIYNSPFKDADNLTGYLSIMYGLGIAKGDGSGYFYPEKNITKAETAVMIYNYLSR